MNENVDDWFEMQVVPYKLHPMCIVFLSGLLWLWGMWLDNGSLKSKNATQFLIQNLLNNLQTLCSGIWIPVFEKWSKVMDLVYSGYETNTAVPCWIMGTLLVRTWRLWTNRCAAQPLLCKFSTPAINLEFFVGKKSVMCRRVLRKSLDISKYRQRNSPFGNRKWLVVSRVLFDRVNWVVDVKVRDFDEDFEWRSCAKISRVCVPL